MIDGTKETDSERRRATHRIDEDSSCERKARRERHCRATLQGVLEAHQGSEVKAARRGARNTAASLNHSTWLGGQMAISALPVSGTTSVPENPRTITNFRSEERKRGEGNIYLRDNIWWI